MLLRTDFLIGNLIQRNTHRPPVSRSERSRGYNHTVNHQLAILGTRSGRLRIPASEPVAAVGHPPAKDAGRNRGQKRPYDGQSEVRRQSQRDESSPEDLALHTYILARAMVLWPLVRPGQVSRKEILKNTMTISAEPALETKPGTMVSCRRLKRRVHVASQRSPPAVGCRATSKPGRTGINMGAQSGLQRGMRG